MAEQVSGGIYGKKIFFLNATFTLNTNIILRLIVQEYEVYKIDDFRQVKSLLKLNPDAIVFVNIDSGNPVKTWFNFIQYFENDKQFENASWGVFSANMKKPDRELFTKFLKLKAGFFPDNKDFSTIMKELTEKLGELHAKGRRQFVRLNCKDNPDLITFYVSGNIMYKMKLLDISSIGCGIKIPLKDAPLLNSIKSFSGLNFMLRDKQVKLNARIHATKQEADGFLVVLIFTSDTLASTRNTIRAFICDESHRALMNKILFMSWDKTDYSNLVHPEDVKEEELSESQKKEAEEKAAADGNSPSTEIFGECTDSDQADPAAEENL